MKFANCQLFGIFDILGARGLYLRRFILFECPLFGIYVHRIYQPDFDRDCHDHPWNFLSIILQGWYVEERQRFGLNSQGRRVWTFDTRKVRWLNYKNATDAHRIESISSPCVTSLVLRGRRGRDWGFYNVLGRWTHADEHFSRNSCGSYES